MGDKKHAQVKCVVSQMMINEVGGNKPETRDGTHQEEEVPLLSRIVWESPTQLSRFHHMAEDSVNNFEQGAT